MTPRQIEEMSWAMAEVYGAVTDRILINLARHFPMIKKNGKIPGAFEYQARMLAQMGQVNRETAQIIMDSLDGADEVLRQNLEKVILESLKAEDPKLRKAAERGLLMGQGFVPPEMSPNQTKAFQAYYKQSADKLNLVNTVMLESTQSAYTATVSDITGKIARTQTILNEASGEVVSGVSSFNQAVRTSVQKMVANGLTGFIDHGGHHWSPEAYVAMDTRTTMANTARAAVWEEDDRYGVDLYQVSHHDGARPLCYPWQGKVISRADWSGEVEDGEGNKVHVYAQSETSFGQAAGLFGVNCGHYPISFIPGFSRIRPPEQTEEQNAKEYEQSQQQRGLERRLREEKRDLAVLKAQGASEEEIRAQRERVRAASDNLDSFCDETGRARRKGREGTPINAKFPDGYQQTRYGKQNPLISTPENAKINHKLDAEGNITTPMNRDQYLRMRKGLENHGIEVIQAEGDDLRYMRSRGAEASYWDGRITHIGETPSASAMFEEIIHATQARIYGELRETNTVELAAREVAAQEKMLKNGKAYGFTEDDFSDIQKNREAWSNLFKKLTGKEYDPNDRASEFYRGV